MLAYKYREIENSSCCTLICKATFTILDVQKKRKNPPVVTYKPAHWSNVCVLTQMARGLQIMGVRRAPPNIQPQMYLPSTSGQELHAAISSLQIPASSGREAGMVSPWHSLWSRWQSYQNSKILPWGMSACEASFFLAVAP